MSDVDQSAMSSGGRSRGRGRPSIGQSIPIRLPDAEKAFVEELGEGVAAKGVRRAISAARKLGKEGVIHLTIPSEEQPASHRGRGRPKIGKQLPVRLSTEEVQAANALGTDDSGKVVTAKGVRLAIRACMNLGLEATTRLTD